MAMLIFDFPDPDTGLPVRAAYCDPVRVVEARRLDDVLPGIHAIERAVAEGYHAAGYLAYEAAPALEPRMRVRRGNRWPLLWFGLFESTSTPAPTSSVGLPAAWELEMERGRYDVAVAAVREAIAEGRTYQLNLTARLRGEAGGDDPRIDAMELYESLRRAQGSGWHALLDLGREMIVSVSPELFFRTAGGHIETRPMKGTRPRGRWVQEDRSFAEELAQSEKDRAENLMIVDLLRNDLGRICETGSVRVPRLFDVERYRTVWQMTSSVEGTLRGDVGLAGILAALFPCGSVTGAPKISTMGLIAELEESPREVYCGAIGLVRPGGEASFSVPIRTLCLDRQSGQAEYGTGGGIVWDSTADSEYDELLTKSVIVREPWPEFELVETMATHAGGIARLELHLERLAGSADYFGFAFPERRVRQALADTALSRPGESEPRRIRLTLAADGVFSIQEGPLGRVGTGSPERDVVGASRDAAKAPAPATPEPVALAAAPVRSSDRFLFHKTTHRDAYDAFRDQADDMFDFLLWNERGEVTEFTRGNVVVEVDGRLTTPPLSAGLLPGCYRRELLEAGTVVEAALRVGELPRATRLWFINSARRWIEVSLAPAR